MKLVCLAVIAALAGIGPAMAGTDSSEAPNPFTDPSAGQPSGSTANTGTANPADPSRNTITVPDQNGTLVPLPADEARSSGSFYQAQKKDKDSH